MHKYHSIQARASLLKDAYGSAQVTTLRATVLNQEEHQVGAYRPGQRFGISQETRNGEKRAFAMMGYSAGNTLLLASLGELRNESGGQVAKAVSDHDGLVARCAHAVEQAYKNRY